MVTAREKTPILGSARPRAFWAPTQGIDGSGYLRSIDTMLSNLQPVVPLVSGGMFDLKSVFELHAAPSISVDSLSNASHSSLKFHSLRLYFSCLNEHCFREQLPAWKSLHFYGLSELPPAFAGYRFLLFSTLGLLAGGCCIAITDCQVVIAVSMVPICMFAAKV